MSMSVSAVEGPLERREEAAPLAAKRGDDRRDLGLGGARDAGDVAEPRRRAGVPLAGGPLGEALEDDLGEPLLVRRELVHHLVGVI